ncbi:glycosyltransferase family 4 protein [Croceimicrobium sp.]|uniref:glycosyltransferase family 4 protein n=1 Tax=Croceimicrobium sp. TaxID=2828340 RepID=UPI003BACBDC9
MQAPILHISTARSWRGGEQQIAYLCLELQKLGVEQHIACIANAPLHHWALEHKIPVLALAKASSIDLRFSARLNRYHKQNKIGLWHAHDAHAHGFAVYAQHFFSASCPLVVSRRVDFPVARSRMSAFKYNHASVSRYLCVSDAIAEILRKSLKNPQRVFTVHSAIDSSRFEGVEKGKLRAEFPQFAEQKWIGNVAALTGHKDLFTFMDTAKNLLAKREDLHFFIAGKGELETELKTYQQKLGLEKQLTFLGFRQDIPEILADLDCFLFSSEMEGLGTSVLDAFASETPVVATNAGGIPEMVKDQKSGILCNVKDASALAKGVMQVLENPDLASQLCQEAKEILREFSPSKMAANTLKHYQELSVS